MVTYSVIKEARGGFAVEVRYNDQVIVPKARLNIRGKSRAEFEEQVARYVRAEAARRLNQALEKNALWPIGRSRQTKSEVA